MLDERETARYERELRAMLRRAGDEDPAGVAVIVGLLDAAQRALPAAVQLCRVEHGYSYTELAEAMGVSRQAVRQRFGVGHPAADSADLDPGRVLRGVIASLVDADALAADRRRSAVVTDVRVREGVL
jgi:hypothetical protein